MNIRELNEYIKRYLEEDKTNSAILLTSPWGTGKSYYIKNELMPFLNTQNQRKCIVISLYGLNELFEVSKGIYIEIRAKMLNVNSERANAGKLIAKTVFKGVTSYFGIDLSTSEKDLKKLYESIDLTGKLIILEDLERSGIDILEVMGYVNNLVEQDGVKVLLVANEQEIFKYNTEEYTDGDGKQQSRIVPTEETEQYLKIKEKTISDTLHFNCDITKAIENIMLSFHNPLFDEFVEQKIALGESVFANNILNDVMDFCEIKNRNLRSFTFACQKINDIFKHVDKTYDTSFLQSIFLATVAFVMRKKQNDQLRWENDNTSPTELGSYKYPLPKFCYDYICFQFLDVDALKNAHKIYCEQKAIKEQQSDINKNLEVIYRFTISTEQQVVDALKFLANCLEQTNDISLYEYGTLANYLFAIESVIGNNKDIDRCKAAMLKNLETVNDDRVLTRLTYHSGIFIDDPDQLEAYKTYKNLMLGKVSQHHGDSFDFDYSTENLHKFCDTLCAQRDNFLSKRVFAQKLDVSKLITLLSNCNSIQIEEIRGVFHYIYCFDNLDEYFANDKATLTELRDKVQSLIDITPDKIKKMQLRYLLDKLNDILSKL